MEEIFLKVYSLKIWEKNRFFQYSRLEYRLNINLVQDFNGKVGWKSLMTIRTSSITLSLQTRQHFSWIVLLNTHNFIIYWNKDNLYEMLDKHTPYLQKSECLGRSFKLHHNWAIRHRGWFKRWRIWSYVARKHSASNKTGRKWQLCWDLLLVRWSSTSLWY